MIALSLDCESIALQLRKSQASTGKEHYWAIDQSGRIFESVGFATHVVADRDLEASYDAVGAGIRYHHSHPDERALSPSDLRVLGRPGVSQVWAHTPDGGAYGVELRPSVVKTDYSAALDRLHGFMDPQIVRVECPPGLSDIDFEELRDLAAIEAFANALWINAYIRLSNSMRHNLAHCIREYRMLIDFFYSKTLAP